MYANEGTCIYRNERYIKHESLNRDQVIDKGRIRNKRINECIRMTKCMQIKKCIRINNNRLNEQTDRTKRKFDTKDSACESQFGRCFNCNWRGLSIKQF